MKDQKQKKAQRNSIRDFFAPLSKDTTPRATTSTSTVPQKKAYNAPTPSLDPTALKSSEQVVLNSDSDDDSLLDVDFGLGAKPTPKPTTTVITTRSKRRSEDEDEQLRKPEKKSKVDKHKFETFIQTVQQKLETEQRIKERKAALEEADEEPVNNTTTITEHATRDQAFITGFVDQVFRIQRLPEELASWMIDQFCSNHNESLNARYLDILESHHEHLETLLGPERLYVLFKAIGANMHQLDHETELAPTSLPKSEHSLPLPPTLKSLARLLEGAAPWLRTKARGHALFMLCHVCLDDRVVADSEVLCAIQDAIEALVCHFADNYRLNSAVGSPLLQDVQSLISSQLSDIIPQLLAKVTHPTLQRNLICAFPARSPLTAYLQRHLALAFLVHPVSVDVPLADPKVSDILLDHLDKSPDFRVNRDVDYSLLAAQFTLLDIAIGPGLSTVPYQPLLSPTPSQAGSSPTRALLPATSEVKNFNNQVDTLARRIKLLGNSIIEIGAGDLSILETKDCIERLVARLEHSVRIGGKKVHNVFGTDEDNTQSKLNKFSKKALKPTTPTPLQSIFDEGEGGA
ncbi:hypothetical protein A1F94_006085 [Pyrenophora tritici-repentis]|nr:hypothetical protein A1F94_006085 [Pyrenophora tritici-repentis]